MLAKVASDAINLNEKFYAAQRTDKNFENFYEQIISDAAGIENIEEPRFPRFRQPPKKIHIFLILQKHISSNNILRQSTFYSANSSGGSILLGGNW